MQRRNFLKGGAAALWLSQEKAEARILSTASEARDRGTAHENSVVIENKEFRLVIGADGITESLVHLAADEELLAPGSDVPAFTVTQRRPYNNELQLALPARETVFPAKSVRQVQDRLEIKFALVDHVLTIHVKVSDEYVSFTVEKIKGSTPLDEISFLQLPVKSRANFGEWLMAAWDSKLAVNLLATDPGTRIDFTEETGYHVFRAGGIRKVGLEGISTALIATRTPSLLDRIGKVEIDFHLPNGVANRRREKQNASYYGILTDLSFETLKEHLRYAKAGGFRTIQIYYRAFCQSVGHFPWRPEFPNGVADLRAIVAEIEKAGFLPGLHFHYNKAGKRDPYVTPVPDDRLATVRTFTLAVPVGSDVVTLTVWKNPQGCTLDKDRTLLKIQKELISYRSFTTEPPYRFEGCRRGELGTSARAHEDGTIFGLLDVDTWPRFIRLNQETQIQHEVAERLAAIYRDAGFRFVYFDGAEDVPPPFWYTVSKAQWEVYRLLNPEPLFAEGSCKSHFSWHILNRGNAFDTFRPELLKEAVRKYPAAEATRVAQDFTRLNFGWMGIWVPDDQTIGTQPDMVEYLTSRAAAWDCPISIQADLKKLRAHPRTPDNLEVIRRWEEVRRQHWLTSAQMQSLRNLDQEHILILDEKRQFELVPYREVVGAVRGAQRIRAFVFERARKVYVVFWHTHGSCQIAVPLPPAKVSLRSELFERPMDLGRDGSEVILPVEGRLYLDCSNISLDEVVRALKASRVVCER